MLTWGSSFEGSKYYLKIEGVASYSIEILWENVQQNKYIFRIITVIGY